MEKKYTTKLENTVELRTKYKKTSRTTKSSAAFTI